MSEVLGKTEDIVKKAKSLGADEVIAKTTIGRYRQTRFSNNQIDITVAWNDYLTDVTLAWRGRVVMTQIRDFRDVDEKLKRLLDLAKVSRENPMFGGFAKGEFKYAESVADEGLRDLENPDEYVFEAIGSAEKEVGPGVNCGGILFTKFEEVYLVSSEGPVGIDNRSAIELSIRAFSQKEASGHGVECSSTLKDFDASRAGLRAGEIAKLAKNPRSGEEGVYDVVLGPLFCGSMLAVWARMASAFRVMVQASIFVDKLGRAVAPEIVSIKDNPARYSVASRTFDDEGVPTRENAFIERGVLKTYLHNTSTAKAFKTETTGNAGIIVPTPWNIEMEPGDVGKDELFNQVKRGLYLTNTWYTRFQNYVTGDFSTIPRDGAFLIDNSEIKHPVKDIRLSDNALELLKNVAGISKERQHVHWWGEADPPSLAPYVLIKNVRITKSK